MGESIKRELERDMIEGIGGVVAIVELSEIVLDGEGVSFRKSDQMFRLGGDFAAIDGAFPLTGVASLIFEMKDVETETIFERSTPREDLDFFKCGQSKDHRMCVGGRFIKLNNQTWFILVG